MTFKKAANPSFTRETEVVHRSILKESLLDKLYPPISTTRRSDHSSVQDSTWEHTLNLSCDAYQLLSAHIDLLPLHDEWSIYGAWNDMYMDMEYLLTSGRSIVLYYTDSIGFHGKLNSFGYFGYESIKLRDLPNSHLK